jgi:chromate transport protein ChrA
MKEDDALLDGGSTTDDDKGRPQVGPTVGTERHRQIVTLVLIALLALIIVGHYVTITVLEWNSKKVDSLTNAFNSVLPVVAGLVGSAVTYYFTKAATQK